MIPDSVADIGNSAFKNCRNLRTATIGSGVYVIPYEAFEGCYNLGTVTLGEWVDTIENYAFNGCNSLTNLIVLGDAISEDPNFVGTYAFSGVPASMVVYVDPNASGWGDTWKGYEVRVGIPGPSATTTTPEPVPHEWLSGTAASILAAHGGDYEAAAMASAANGVNKVWECYVAGISPADPAARFLATITMDADGKPEISHNPPLSAEEEAKREFRVLGKRMLDPDEDWTDVTDIPDPDAAGYRFFKVTVRMRE